MKTELAITGFFGKVILISFIMMFLAGYGYAAQISFMAGDVTIIKNGKKESAKLQMKLDSGDILKTGKMSFADISYDDGTVVKVSEKSSITIGNRNVKASDSLSVTSGMISAKFAKLQKESPRKMYTPTTVCAVRGTEFSVAVSESADSRIQMTEGELELSNPYGQTIAGGDQSVEVKVAAAPSETEGGNFENWMTESENKLDDSPEEQADAFSQYLKDFQKKNDNISKDVKTFEKNKKTATKGDKESLEELVQKLNNLEVDVQDDMYLTSAADNSLDGILNRFRKDKQAIYNNFLKIKRESNKVLDQQKRNYQAIASVKEAYKKAYDSIMNKHKGEVDKIKGSYDKDKVKPKK